MKATGYYRQFSYEYDELVGKTSIIILRTPTPRHTHMHSQWLWIWDFSILHTLKIISSKHCNLQNIYAYTKYKNIHRLSNSNTLKTYSRPANTQQHTNTHTHCLHTIRIIRYLYVYMSVCKCVRSDAGAKQAKLSYKSINDGEKTGAEEDSLKSTYIVNGKCNSNSDRERCTFLSYRLRWVFFKEHTQNQLEYYQTSTECSKRESFILPLNCIVLHCERITNEKRIAEPNK